MLLFVLCLLGGARQVLKGAWRVFTVVSKKSNSKKVGNIEDLIRRSPTLFIECLGYLEEGFPKDCLFFRFVGPFVARGVWVLPNPLVGIPNRALVLLP